MLSRCGLGLMTQTSNSSINPFATRFVRPGQLPWIAANDANQLACLPERFSRMRKRAAIIGPHGSGKSTLLEHLVPQLGQVVFRRTATGEITEATHAGPQSQAPPTGSVVHCPIIWLTLRRGSIQLFRNRWRSGVLLVIDGFEQLSRCNRLLVLYQTWLRKTGLLVTSHQPVGLPALVKTEVTLRQLKQIIQLAVSQKSPSQQSPPIDCKVHLFSDNHLRQLLDEHRGNAREIMMTLYDEVTAESCPRNSPPKVPTWTSGQL